MKDNQTKQRAMSHESHDARGADLSALMDGEAPARGTRRDALGALARDPELAATWARYHAYGDALRDALPAATGAAAGVALHERVRDALRDEPAMLAPKRRFSRPQLGAAAAVAASCAMAVVLVVGGALRDPVGSSPGLAADLTLAPSVTEVLPAAAEAGPAATTDYNPYLVRHSEYRASTGAPGMNPYARLIGHEQAASSAP